MELMNLTAVINGKKYRTETAAMLAHDCYWDGSNFERNGRNTWLLRTPRGRYFLQHQTLWQGERDYIEPVSKEEAIRWYEDLPEKEVEFEEAFPGVAVKEA